MGLIVFGIVMMAAGFVVLRIGQAMTEEPVHVRRPPRRVPAAPRATPPAEVAMATPQSGKAGAFGGARLGQTIVYRHPERGEITGRILGTIRYEELWQRRKAPAEPWIPTGNVFPAHWLGDVLLYEWKGRLWLLESYDQLTDAEIKQHILPHAQKFGQSDETAEVYFAYPPASWKITDIGKFRVQSVEGQGLRLNAGAVGRFLHAEGSPGYEGRALIVEDYQEGGGGQDTAWLGWKLTWDDLLDVR